MKEDIPKHLEFIQGAINRMAANSFLLKDWTVTLVAALFALAAKDTDANFAVLAFFPAISFWGLDAYYLRQERLFRKLYDAVRSTKEKDIDKIEPYSLDTSSFKKDEKNWFLTLWSPTIIALHGIVIAAIIIVVIYLRCLAK